MHTKSNHQHHQHHHHNNNNSSNNNKQQQQQKQQQTNNSYNNPLFHTKFKISINLVEKWQSNLTFTFALIICILYFSEMNTGYFLKLILFW